MLNFIKTKRVPIEKIETVIGGNTSFSGHLKCDGHIRIDGVCEDGIIETVGNVLVTSDGRVSAKIIAENVSVAGEVTGEIVAHGRLEIIGEGCVSGTVNVANFYKDETARLEGTLLMEDEAESVADDATATAAEVTPEPSMPNTDTSVDEEEPKPTDSE